MIEKQNIQKCFNVDINKNRLTLFQTTRSYEKMVTWWHFVCLEMTSLQKWWLEISLVGDVNTRKLKQQPLQLRDENLYDIFKVYLFLLQIKNVHYWSSIHHFQCYLIPKQLTHKYIPDVFFVLFIIEKMHCSLSYLFFIVKIKENTKLLSGRLFVKEISKILELK